MLATPYIQLKSGIFTLHFASFISDSEHDIMLREFLESVGPRRTLIFFLLVLLVFALIVRKQVKKDNELRQKRLAKYRPIRDGKV